MRPNGVEEAESCTSNLFLTCTFRQKALTTCNTSLQITTSIPKLHLNSARSQLPTDHHWHYPHKDLHASLHYPQHPLDLPHTPQALLQVRRALTVSRPRLSARLSERPSKSISSIVGPECSMRARTNRSIAHTRISWIYLHGVELEKGKHKYWPCKHFFFFF
jgi:hypothetical protein